MIYTSWTIYAKNKVNEILAEVADSLSLKTPIPIKEVIERYVGDVQIVERMDIDFPPGVSAFSTKDMQTGWVIAVNPREPTERQRFSLAHELAHIVLILNQPKKIYCSHESKGWDEKLCDRFAGDILMPEAMIRDLYKSTPSPYIEDVAKMFKVSRDVAKIQLGRLGLPFEYRFG